MVGLLVQLGVNYLAFKTMPDYLVKPYKRFAIVAFPALYLALFVLTSVVTFSWDELFSLKQLFMTILMPALVQFGVNHLFEDWIRKK
jgi:hypothetical protein